MRGKSFEDLHKLWWVCLKEKNALTTDRLYFNQVGVEMPDASRVKKVKKSMAHIKRVLWERHRATDLAVEERSLNPESLPPHKGEPVTLKKFGRKVTVPSDHVWASTPTRAEKKDLARRQRSAARHRAKAARAEMRRAEAEAAVPEEVRAWYKQREAGLLRKTSVDDAVGRAEVDERFGAMDADLEALRESAALEVVAAASRRNEQRNRSQKSKNRRAKHEVEAASEPSRGAAEGDSDGSERA